MSVFYSRNICVVPELCCDHGETNLDIVFCWSSAVLSRVSCSARVSGVSEHASPGQTRSLGVNINMPCNIHHRRTWNIINVVKTSRD